MMIMDTAHMCKGYAEKWKGWYGYEEEIIAYHQHNLYYVRSFAAGA